MFSSRNKKNNIYHCKPQFYYKKVGLMESKSYRHVFCNAEDQLVVFLCFSSPVVLFVNAGTSKCLNTLFLLSPHRCFIIGFICNSFVAMIHG